MGVCASSQITRRHGGAGGLISSQSTTKLIHVDGRLQEFKQPMRAGDILSQNPNCFLCSSENMHLDTYIPHVAETEELQPGQIYFLMPLSQSQNPLSISELCALAIKASTALTRNERELNSVKALTFSGGKNVTLLSKSRRGRQIPATRYSDIRLGSKMGRGDRGE